MKLIDRVRMSDSAMLRLVGKAGVGLSRLLATEEEQPLREVTGWVTLTLRERGKLVRKVTGKNVWTNTGGEYLALHQTADPSAPVGTPYRVDLIGYLGVGNGTQVATANVLSLNAPLETTAGIFLTPITTADFPILAGDNVLRRVVRYIKVFEETDISTGATSVDVSELGLFTTGDPSTLRGSGPRSIVIGDALAQAPVAYKVFEPFAKPPSMQLEVDWSIHF